MWEWVHDGGVVVVVVVVCVCVWGGGGDTPPGVSLDHHPLQCNTQQQNLGGRGGGYAWGEGGGDCLSVKGGGDTATTGGFC